MHRAIAALLVVIPLGWQAAGSGAKQPPPAQDTSIDVQKVADGVYAAIRRDPPGLMVNSNSVFIVNDEDVVVVDTTLTIASARATLAALRTLTPKVVKYVINTHWHDDHVLGNQIFREAFPDAQFVGHARSAQQLSTTGEASRKRMLDLAPQMTQQFRLSLEQSKSMAGGTLTEDERRSYQHDIAVTEQFLAESPTVSIVAPTVTVSDTLTLTRGKRSIEILHLGSGHTSEDLVVHLPRERVLVTGDLVASPIPLVGSTSHPAEFAATLDKLMSLQPAVLVPGHGPVLKGLEFVRLEARLLTSLTDQVRAAAAAGSTLAQTRKIVNLAEFEKAFAGDSQLLRFIFGFSVTTPGIGAAYRDAVKR